MVDSWLGPDLLAAVGRSLPEDVSIAVRLRGPGGGEWTLRREDAHTRVTDGSEPTVDCILECSVADFGSLIRGELDGRQGFFDGRLRIRGDVGLALGLERALRTTPVPVPRRSTNER